ncbi:uncharacterized protein A4U43_C03F15150 [Asparagus officinalis]|uniref:Uncharacterized protein n=1 Tax=Asparagus officinalis TaxID=4686 RepID=A0A5P1FBZ8_ASPOF|nr:uncharacterized protein A4U43_C03F15150 [Asparagus officinalis]
MATDTVHRRRRRSSFSSSLRSLVRGTHSFSVIPSIRLCENETSTTVDPSYIISLIRQLLPRDVEKPDVSKSPSSVKETMVMQAHTDLCSNGDMIKGYIENFQHLPVDKKGSSFTNGDDGTHQEFGDEERAGIPEHTGDSEIKDPWEDSGCILWDLSANKSHAEFMVDNFLLDVLLASLLVSRSLRVTEICLGIIGNLACHDDLGRRIVSKSGLIETVVQQLFLDDSTCLSETFRLLTAGLQGNKFASWAEALLPDQVLLRVLWIIGNTLNTVLLGKSTDFLLTIVSNQEVSTILLQPLVELGLPNLIAGLLASELSKLEDETKLERFSVLDSILGLVEALSATDNYSKVIISNEELLPLICALLKLPEKIEVANSCVSAIVILANLLVDEQHIASKFSQDFSFLQGLLEILPLVSEDPQSRSAFWCIMARLLGEVQEDDISISALQQFASLFANKSHLIEEDIESHPMEDLDESPSIPEGHNATAIFLRRLASILKKWVSVKSAIPEKGVADSNEDNESKIQRLLHYCCKYVRLK